MRGSFVLLILSFVLVAVFSRLVPHPANFTALNAIALTGPLYFGSAWISFFVVVSSMLLTDVLLGFHPVLSFIYLSFGLIVCFGKCLKKNSSCLEVLSLTVFSSLLFFFLSNFGEWLMGPIYPKTMVGFIACYTAAIPFFSNQLLGDLAYTAVLFYGYQIVQQVNFLSYLNKFLLRK